MRAAFRTSLGVQPNRWRNAPLKIELSVKGVCDRVDGRVDSRHEGLVRGREPLLRDIPREGAAAPFGQLL